VRRLVATLTQRTRRFLDRGIRRAARTARNNPYAIVGVALIGAIGGAWQIAGIPGLVDLSSPGRSVEPTPKSAAPTCQYDVAGRLVAWTNAEGGTHRYVLGWRDELLAWTDPLGETVTYAHDGMRQRVGVVDQLGGQYYVMYDGFGRVAKIDDANGREIFVEYAPDQPDLALLRHPGGGQSTESLDQLRARLAMFDPPPSPCPSRR
jgi:YD repeat-containing protein